VRRLTRRQRVLPDFLILGAQRGGTTSLARFLERQPGVSIAPVKEVHFFDLHFDRGIDWYRSHFPLALRRRWEERVRGRPLLSGEATPYYLFHPLAPERVHATLPEARLIALLRNPVDRALSQYHHEVRWGCEDAPSFAEALDREENRLAGEEDRLHKEAGYRSVSHNHHSYRARGLYARQLRAWLKWFPREQLLVLRSEDLFTAPRPTLARVLEFLGLPARELGELPHFNEARYPELDRALRGRLAEWFRPHDEELRELLGFDPGWDG